MEEAGAIAAFSWHVPSFHLKPAGGEDGQMVNLLEEVLGEEKTSRRVSMARAFGLASEMFFVRWILLPIITRLFGLMPVARADSNHELGKQNRAPEMPRR